MTTAHQLPSWIDTAAQVTDHTTPTDPVPGVVIDRYPDGSLLITWLDGSGLTERIPADQTDTLRCGLVHLPGDPCMQCEDVDPSATPARGAA